MKKTLTLALLTLLVITSASAASGNYTEIRNQLEDARNAIQKMENAGIPTERVESLYTTANRSFMAQKTLAEQQGIKPDFSRTRELVNQIINIKQTAMRVNDRINSLEERINELEKRDLNLTGVKQAFQNLNQTFQNQRFEEAENQVEKVYAEISEAQSVQTQVQAFASAQQENLATIYQNSLTYAVNNWKKLSIATILGIILVVVSFREYKLWRLEKRREDMLDKKEVIEDMIEEAQHQYFVKGKGSEIAFNTRMDKFQEMKRDTEQEINELESRLQSIKGLPVISPEIKERSEEFQAQGEVMEEAGEVKGSLERISERREKEQEDTKETEEQEVSEEKAEDQETGSAEKYSEILEKDSVKEAKEEIEGLENPDHRTLLEIEKKNKNRKTLKEYLSDNIELELEDVDYTEEEKELLEQDTVKEARDEIKELEEPDYKALVKAEKEGKDRKTLKEYLKEQIRSQ